MNVNVATLVCLVFCSNVWCEKVSPVDSEETDDTIKQVVELLTAHELKTDDQQLTGGHKPRIVGGSPAKYGDYPWHVSLYYRGRSRFICGGSIINKRTILTSGACVYRVDKRFMIKAGDHLRWKTDEYEQSINVEEIILHPRFNRRRYKFDLAILKLEEDLEFNGYVQPIAIPAPWKERFLMNSERCVNTGLGRDEYPGRSTPWVMQVVESTLKGPWFCQNYVKTAEIELPFNPTYQICSYDEDRGPCYADGGGPYVCYDSDDVPYQMGVVSWGSRDCLEGFAVYPRVSAFAEWIEENS